ncbi:MAG: gliding motility-associated C-terminal domain-containing protein, partial [Bacteroidota bacterium]
NNNTATCTSVITVEDATSPAASCADITISLDSDGMVTIAGTDIDNGSSDNCPGVLTFSASPSVFTCAQIGAQAVTLTVTDTNGNDASCTATVTVEDNGNPIALCKNLTVYLDGTGAATVTGAQLDGGSTDGCSGIGALSLEPAMINYDCDSIGTRIVTLTVTDENGNSANCTAIVTVQDVTNPTAGCQNTTVQLDNTGNITLAAEQLNNGSSDECGGTLGYTPASFSYTCANLGVNNVTLTVSDVAGNTATCTAVVTVQDLTPPVAQCKNATVFLGSNGMGTVTSAQMNNNSTDNCGPLTFSPATINYNCNDVGVHTETLTVTDGQGNSSSCTAEVTVNETIDPIAVCQGVTASLNATGTATVLNTQINNGSTDNCTSQGDLLLTPANFTFDCTNLGANTVVLTVTDSYMNTATCTAVVNIEDNTAPTAVCQNLTLSLGASGIVNITGAQMGSGSSDNCQGTLYFSPDIEYSCSNIGANTIQLIVSDSENNTASCTSVITVQDVTAPAVVCQNLTVYLTAAGTASVTSAQIDNGTTDNC